jgi:hypothetical protein
MGAYDPVPNRAGNRNDVNADLDVSGIWDYVPKAKKSKTEPKYRVMADPSRGRRTLPWGQNYKTGNARD